jgi:hypothetical protein
LLTTATCLWTQNQPIDHEKLQVAIKETEIYGDSSTKIAITEIKLHENFMDEKNKFQMDYNVGLLISETDIPFSLHVRPICLPQSDEFDFDGKLGTIVGWGFDENFQQLDRLHQIEVPTNKLLSQTCFFQNRAFFRGHSSIRNFCAGFNDRGICTGKKTLLVRNEFSNMTRWYIR